MPELLARKLQFFPGSTIELAVHDYWLVLRRAELDYCPLDVLLTQFKLETSPSLPADVIERGVFITHGNAEEKSNYLVFSDRAYGAVTGFVLACRVRLEFAPQDAFDVLCDRPLCVVDADAVVQLKVDETTRHWRGCASPQIMRELLGRLRAFVD